MAVVSQIATLRIDDVATHTTNFIQWVATAAVQDTPEGDSVVVTVVRTIGGLSPPAPPDTLELRVRDTAETLLATFTLNPGPGSQTATVYLRINPADSGSSPRHGTLILDLYGKKIDAPTNWEIETDGSPNTPPAGFHTHTIDRGFIRGTTALTEKLSNISAGGAQNEPAEYDETLFIRATMGSQSYTAYAPTYATSVGSVSGALGNTTAVNHDVTRANVCDDRFPAAVTAVGVTITVPNEALTGIPYTAFHSTVEDTIDIDPRLTASHHFQTDDDVFAVSKNDTDKAMLSTQTGFLATRFVTSRTATGVNSLTVTQANTPVAPGTAVSGSSSTATRDGQAGWTDLLAWPSSKPGGAWNKTTDITAPADIDNNAHVVSGTDVLTMLAPDPRIEIFIQLGPTTSSEDDHLHPGDSAQLVFTAASRKTRKRLAPDAGTVFVKLIRWNRTLSRFEYLATDGTTWTHWSGTTTVADSIALTDVGDGITFTKVFVSTSSWGTADIVAASVAFEIGGTPYGFPIARELVGLLNKHHQYEFDGPGFVGFPTR